MKAGLFLLYNGAINRLIINTAKKIGGWEDMNVFSDC
jgi:hypothetical protein